MEGSQRLFSTHELSDVLAERERQLGAKVEAFDDELVLSPSPEDILNHLVAAHSADPLEIDESQAHISRDDVQIDVSNHLDRFVTDRSRPAYVTGTRITFFVPFTGDRTFFLCRALHHSLSAPRGAVADGELILAYDRTRERAANIRSEFDQDIASVKQSLGWLASDITAFNLKLPETASRLIKERREKLLEDRSLVAGLGFPLKGPSGLQE